jgi:hypothetical protein
MTRVVALNAPLAWSRRRPSARALVVSVVALLTTGWPLVAEAQERPATPWGDETSGKPRCNPLCDPDEVCTPEGRCVPAEASGDLGQRPDPQAGDQAADADVPPPPPPPPNEEPGKATGPTSTSRAPASGPPAFNVEPEEARPEPEHDMHRLRLAAGLHVGLGGALKENDLTGVSTDLAPTVGFHLRLDIPVADFLAIGPMAIFSAYITEAEDDLGAARSLLVDIAVFPRFRFAFGLGFGHLEVYAGPFGGLTTGVRDELEFDAGIGFNVGALGGAQLFFGRFGVLVEGGFIHHDVSHNSDFGADLDFRTDQAVINLGIALMLGG